MSMSQKYALQSQNILFYYVVLTGQNSMIFTLFQADSTRGGGHSLKVPAAFFSETVKATTIKLGTLTN